MEINREDERPDVVMTIKDKDDINKFASHLAHRNDLRERITRKKKLIQVHEDAADEMVIMDDEAEVYYNIGDVFFRDEKTHIETKLDDMKDTLLKEVRNHEEEVESIEKEMTALKASLYAKFGKVRLSLSRLSFLSRYLELFSLSRRQQILKILT